MRCTGRVRTCQMVLSDLGLWAIASCSVSGGCAIWISTAGKRRVSAEEGVGSITGGPRHAASGAARHVPFGFECALVGQLSCVQCSARALRRSFRGSRALKEHSESHDWWFRGRR